MGEPVNTKKREAVEVRKGKIDMHQRKQGETPKFESFDAPQSGVQDMDLSDVDNENKENYNSFEVSRKKEDWHNAKFDDLHDDFELVKDSKKEKNAGR